MSSKNLSQNSFPDLILVNVQFLKSYEVGIFWNGTLEVEDKQPHVACGVQSTM